ncbi:transglutaminase-like domain-containing protein [Microcella humidisoli]|jgi:transglutaminase-like putative cysteine protease|uniref:Transglutaminase family protein n=1 Tax=Microcella humidisoli TaxID=2963406 RepID=A0ABY5FY44_9MICO|nr:transglutaminase family protein [Microcella humidisoli]UTT62676.1 transglutaminase family protein [Microcella humidisoli]
MDIDRSMRRTVGCEIDATLGEATAIVLAVAVSSAPGLMIDERLEVTAGGAPLAMTEVVGFSGTRWHTADAPEGPLTIRYSATVTGRGAPRVVDSTERILAVRPSRYVQSDELAGPLIDASIIEGLCALPERERLLAAREWVAGRLAYTPGSTSPTDGLPEILATGQGVCRDFAHLLAGVLRATDIPARVVSVYAPQLQPMDFHAVVEALVDEQWVVADATGLAPRTGMLRIATGRDAADTAFLANDGTSLTLQRLHVHAEADALLDEDARALLPLG